MNGGNVTHVFNGLTNPNPYEIKEKLYDFLLSKNSNNKLVFLAGHGCSKRGFELSRHEAEDQSQWLTPGEVIGWFINANMKKEL